MVSNGYNQAFASARWSFYLAFAACLLFGITTQVSLQKPEPTSSLLEPIKIKLVALAAPKPTKMETAPIQPIVQAPAVEQTFSNKIITTNTAPKTIVKKLTELQEIAPVPPEKVVKSELKQKPMPKEPLKPTEPITVERKTVPQIEQETPEKSQEIQVAQSLQQKADEEKDEPNTPVNVASLSQENAEGGSSATVIQDARYRRKTAPVYPRRALDLGQQGIVLIHAHIMPDGHTSEIKVAESSGHRLLDMSALSAVKKWEFEPVHHNGTPSQGWVRVPVRFVIQ